MYIFIIFIFYLYIFIYIFEYRRTRTSNDTFSLINRKASTDISFNHDLINYPLITSICNNHCNKKKYIYISSFNRLRNFTHSMRSFPRYNINVPAITIYFSIIKLKIIPLITTPFILLFSQTKQRDRFFDVLESIVPTISRATNQTTLFNIHRRRLKEAPWRLRHVSRVKEFVNNYSNDKSHANERNQCTECH